MSNIQSASAAKTVVALPNLIFMSSWLQLPLYHDGAPELSQPCALTP